MDIIGSGMDAMEIERIANSIERYGDRFLRHVFTAGEIAYCRRKRDSASSFAARFAAKEATVKVFRVMAHDAIDPRSIEVRQLPEGACEIVLHDGAIALARRSGITELSMSHEQDYATATVVACFAPVGDATRSRG